MKQIAGRVHSISAAFRRPQIPSRCYGSRISQAQVWSRNKATSTQNDPNSDSLPSQPFSSNTHPDIKPSEVTKGKNEAENKDKASSPRAPNSAPASAGASIPSIPDPTSTSVSLSLRQRVKRSAVGRAAAWYGREQDQRPYWTQFWSTLVIYLCGDISAQLVISNTDDSPATTIEDGHDEKAVGADKSKIQSLWETYDPARTLRHLAVGGIACVPVYKWFMFLHNNFNFASKTLSILTKVAISQSCFTPTFNTYFFSMHSLLAGASLEETWERVKKALPSSLINSVKLWPAVTAFMFLYIDPQFRSVFSGVIAVGWQTYLSWLNQKAAREVREEEEAEADLARQQHTDVLAKLPGRSEQTLAQAS